MVERSLDACAVRSVLERVRADVWDEPGEIPVPPYWHYFLAYEGPELAGVVAFAPINAKAAEVHVAIVPEFQRRGLGKRALQDACALMLDAGWEKVTCCPPAFNERMTSTALGAGFRIEGISPKSLPWRGAMHDRVMLGFEKGRSLCLG